MTTKTHWKVLINPDYLGAYSLPNAEDLTVTIDFVQTEEITGSGGKKEHCTVAHINGNKPLILNVTNSKSIAKLYGPFIEDWAGKQVTLFATTTKLAGEVVECLRIRPKVAVRERKPIDAKKLEQAIAAIKAGTYTTIKLNAMYALTDEQNTQLAEALSNETA
jgi:hypothetical protein